MKPMETAASVANRDAAVAPTPSPDLQVTWPRELLDAPPEVAAAAFARSLHGFARRLDPSIAARFAMFVDTPLYEAIDAAVLRGYGDVHPKHWLTDYHDFFVSRIKAGQRVIDLGCGVGMVALSIVQRSGAMVTGVDWSEGNLAVAQRIARERAVADRLTLVRGDICDTRAEGTFDVIVLSNVLEHIDRRPERLRQWLQWYQPSRVLIRVPAFERDYRVPLKKELGIDWRCDPTHEIEHTREALEREMQEAGLSVREIITKWCEYWVDASPK